jgi:hypothetical protein
LISPRRVKNMSLIAQALVGPFDRQLGKRKLAMVKAVLSTR